MTSFSPPEVCDTDAKIWRSLDLGQGGSHNPARPPLCRVQRSSSVPGNADAPETGSAKVRDAFSPDLVVYFFAQLALDLNVVTSYL